MFWSKPDKEKERFYLLPGMGGRAYRRKQKFILQASIIVGLLVSLAFGLIVYFMHQSPK